MPVFLRERNTRLIELMDQPDVSLTALFRTYDGFARLNPVLARWGSVYDTHLVPLMRREPQKQYTLLDIGCGGGDLLRSLKAWAESDGFKLSVLGIDPDPRAEAYVVLVDKQSHIHYRCCTLETLVQEQARFDFVISNHLLHHLKDAELQNLLEQATEVCRGLVVMNDIERSDWAFLAFSFSWLFFWRTFIPVDGARSIRRSFTKEELQQRVSAPWKVQRRFPFRLLLTRSCS
jgi:2-polyprenyl-3-methyl-5-hydroxy-6-metoxy-1,4-benzoquinol methylase